MAMGHGDTAQPRGDSGLLCGGQGVLHSRGPSNPNTVTPRARCCATSSCSTSSRALSTTRPASLRRSDTGPGCPGDGDTSGGFDQPLRVQRLIQCPSPAPQVSEDILPTTPASPKACPPGALEASSRDKQSTDSGTFSLGL